MLRRTSAPSSCFGSFRHFRGRGRLLSYRRRLLSRRLFRCDSLRGRCLLRVVRRAGFSFSFPSRIALSACSAFSVSSSFRVFFFMAAAFFAASSTAFLAAAVFLTTSSAACLATASFSAASSAAFLAASSFFVASSAAFLAIASFSQLPL